MTDLTPILEAVITLTVAIITVFVIPWIASKTSAQERETMLKWVDIAVSAAQQLFHNLDGAQRLDYALQVLAERGYDVDDAAVLNAVEAAVLRLHQQLEGTTNDG